MNVSKGNTICEQCILFYLCNKYYYYYNYSLELVKPFRDISSAGGK